MSFGCHCFDQKANEIFLRISALASNKRLNQKLYLKNYVKYPLISVPSNVEVASQSYICCSLVYNALHCFDQKTNKIFLRISALASKTWTNQKNKGTLLH